MQTIFIAFVPVLVISAPAPFPLRLGAIYVHSSGLLVRLKDVYEIDGELVALVYHHGQVPFYAELHELFRATLDQVHIYLGDF